MEWIMLKRSFNPLKTASSYPSIYWDALNNAVDQQIQLTQSCMRNWIKNITTVRNNLIQLVPADAVDSVIKGKMISVLKRTKHPAPSITLIWFYKSNKWSDDYEQNPASITWKFLKVQILKETAKHPDTPTPPGGVPRPRLNPLAPANVALLSETQTVTHDDMNAIAYQDALVALGSDPHAHKVCDNCGGKGHRAVICPSEPRVANASAMRQRTRTWQGSGGAGGRGSPYNRDCRAGGQQRGCFGAPRGGDGRGSEAQRRNFGGQRAGGGGQLPARGGGGGAPRAAAPARLQQLQQSYALLDVVSGADQDIDAQAMVGIGAYKDEEDEQYEPEPGSSSAELGQQFRDSAFVHGQDFGCRDATADVVPDFPNPDDGIPRAHVTRIQPPTKTSTLGKIGKAMIYYLPTLPLLPTVFATTTCIRQHLPHLSPQLTPSLITCIMMMTWIMIMMCPRTSWAEEIATHTCFVTTNMSGSTSITYLVDCACTISIISDARFTANVRPAPPNFVCGFNGGRCMDYIADLHLPVASHDQTPHTIIIPGVFYNPGCDYNLLSSDQLNDNGYGIELPVDKKEAAVTSPADKHNVSIPISRVGKLYSIPVHRASHQDETAFNAVCGSMSLEELVHLRMAHTPITRLAAMSRLVHGLPRHLQFSKIL